MDGGRRKCGFPYVNTRQTQDRIVEGEGYQLGRYDKSLSFLVIPTS